MLGVALLVTLVARASALGADVRVVAVTNNTGAAAADLHITFTGTGGNISVVPETVIAPGACPIPAVPSNGAVTNTAVINWGVACVPNGATVRFVASTTNGPLVFSSGNWTGVGGGNIGAVGAGDITMTAATGAAGNINVPITASVRPPCGGAAGAQLIGTIGVAAGGGGIPNRLVADFPFLPAFAWLDKWYDFKWVNVQVAYIVGGAPLAVDPVLGMLPAIDPQPGAGDADFEPYYYDNDPDQWGPDNLGPGGSCVGQRIHHECVRSRFCDHRSDPAGIVVFKTFLVIDDITNNAISNTHFCVLDGFSWFLNGPTGTTGIVGAVASAPVLINAAMANAGGAGFPGWMARPAADCPLQACPVQLKLTCESLGHYPPNPDCCIFNFEVTNNGPMPVGEFYIDLEAGSGGFRCRTTTFGGWNITYCYPWDYAWPPSNWGVLCFMSPDANNDMVPDDPLLPGQTRRGTMIIDPNGPDPKVVNIPGWHPFVVPPKGIHAHITDYSPLCLGVNCAAGQFGPHIASDIHGRDQSCFWGPPSDWICCKPVPSIPPGVDLFMSPAGNSHIGQFTATPIPDGFFGPGSLSFSGVVSLTGVPYGGPLGTTDTVVERLGSADFSCCPGGSATVPIVIRALRLRSEAPITVNYAGGGSELWSMRVVLSDVPQPIGSMTITSQCLDGGEWSSTLPVLWKALFTRLSDGATKTFDAGLMGFPPVLLDNNCGGPCHWSYTSGPDHSVISVPAGTLVDGNADGIPEVLGVGTSNFIPGLRPVPCPELPDPCKDESEQKDKELTEEESMLDEHGILPPQDQFPGCQTCPGDTNSDNRINGRDIRGFVRCYLEGIVTVEKCPCADMNNNGVFDGGDIPRFVQELLNPSPWPIPPIRVIQPGHDLFVTGPGSFHNFAETPIPADFFFPGSAPFTGTVNLQGSPIGNYQGFHVQTTDTIVRRHQGATFYAVGDNDTIPIELVALSLTSINPISVGPTTWDVRVTASGEVPSLGSMTLTLTAPAAGTYRAQLSVTPKFTFTQVAGPNPGQMLTLDAGAIGYPPIDISTSQQTPWHQTPTPGQLVVPGLNGGNFFIQGPTHHTGPHPVVTPTPDTGPTLGACCLPGGGCFEGTPNQCFTQNGQYMGDGSTCGTVFCPGGPTGACCLPGGICVDGQTAHQCGQQGGTYQGDGSVCTPTTCQGGGCQPKTVQVTPNLPIPDNNTAGVQLIIFVPPDPLGCNFIADLDVEIIIQHTWQGDLVVQLQGPGGQLINLINRPGWPQSPSGFSADNFGNPTTLVPMLLDDKAAQVYDFPQVPPPGINNVTGNWRPDLGPLSVFDGTSKVGQWRLVVLDLAPGDVGVVRHVSLNFTNAP